MIKEKNNYYIILPLVCGIIYVVLEAIKTTYDNDLWWLLATGKEIVTNGIPMENPWAIHEGLNIVIQQWIPSVILYLLYSRFGMIGIEILLVGLISVLFVVLYALCMVCTDKKCGGEIALTVILISFFSLYSYFSCRPQVYSMIGYSAIILVLEKYRRCGNKKYLIWLPVITLLHVNLHAAMVLFDLFIILLYLIPDLPAFIRKKSENFAIVFDKASYPRKPLLIAFAISAAVLVINPYGIRGALYLLESYGAASYQNFISEMNPLQIYTVSGIADLVLIIIGSIAVGHNGIKKINFPLTILFFITTGLSIMKIRNVWLVALFSIPLIMSSIGDGKIHFELPRRVNKKLILAVESFILLDIILLYGFANVWPTVVEYIKLSKADDFGLPQKAAAWLADYSMKNEIDKNTINLFCTFENGGYLEYCGYRVNMDARPELWEPSITENENHYYREYCDFMKGNVEIKEYVNKYDFDFYFVRNDSGTEKYMQENPGKYEIAEEGNGYKMWKNIGKTS